MFTLFVSAAKKLKEDPSSKDKIALGVLNDFMTFPLSQAQDEFGRKLQTTLEESIEQTCLMLERYAELDEILQLVDQKVKVRAELIVMRSDCAVDVCHHAFTHKAKADCKEEKRQPREERRFQPTHGTFFSYSLRSLYPLWNSGL